MGTSTAYTVTDVIEMALRKLGVLGEGATATTNQKSDAVEILNCIIKTFDSDIYNRWFIKSASTDESFTAGTANNTLATDVLSIEAAIWVPGSGTATQLSPLTHKQYSDIAVKTTQGTPTHYFVSTDVALSTGQTVFLYPVPSANGTFRYYYRRAVDIFDNVTSDTCDFPDAWLYWVVCQLAADLAEDYGKSEQQVARMQAKADAIWQRIMQKEMLNPYSTASTEE